MLKRLNSARFGRLLETVRPRNLRLISQLFVAAALALSSAMVAGPAEAKVVFQEVVYKLSDSQLPVRQWQDDTKRPKAIIVAVHGAARHGGTFHTLAEQLAATGYMIVCPDMRGHGEWVQPNVVVNGDEGKIADYEKSADDVVFLVNELRSSQPRVPIFCLGESAGAAVAVRAAAQCPEINGLVLSALGTKPVVHDLKMVVGHVITGIQHFDKPLDIMAVMGAFSSDDQRICKEMNDPMGRNAMSARELLRTNSLIGGTPSAAEKLSASIPVLMIQGENDQIVSANSAKNVLKHIPSQEKELKYFPTGHVLLATQYIRPDVLESVTGWLTSKTAEQQMALLGSNPAIRK